ncbi:transmembrane protein 88B isoform X1 [Phyllopteryx taeniolatus]|uniref:transmembrane protein 88B isoform X1 n=1 Tax=Phyllopteryx taeniolatus TaxID=161469 RepID=UPI002AD2AE47|nr:transmembrane protein 88B isoform X1 [Phyllopteryx taeniolatus]
MCGTDVDLDDEGSVEEEREEDLWMGERVKMLPPPVAHSQSSAWGSRRSGSGCVVCGAALVLWNVCVLLAGALLLTLIFSLVLLPAVVLLYVGFLCHSRPTGSEAPAGWHIHSVKSVEEIPGRQEGGKPRRTLSHVPMESSSPATLWRPVIHSYVTGKALPEPYKLTSSRPLVFMH